MKRIVKHFFNPLIILFVFCTQAIANGITVSNVSVLPNSNQVQFDITWDNSWRSDILQNWDAAWVFVKYRDVDGSWKHLNFTGINNAVPAGYKDSVTADNRGVFLYRAVSGNGTASLTGVKLGIPAAQAFGVYDLKVFAIEMVYVPTGQFFAGDRESTNSLASFVDFTSPATVNGISAVFAPLVIVSPPFPTGYSNFYCMKYEISQGAYRDFLNTLTYLQQTGRTANLPNSPVGTNALTNATAGRPYIEIAVPGNSGTNTPAVYGCDANNNNSYNEAADGEWVACNYLNWADLAAYLTWACLAPMTELQYEKVCRGPLQPVGSEFAWGTAQVASVGYALNNGGFTNEFLTGLSSNPNEGNANYLTTNPNPVFNAAVPLRNGIFATATSNRISSGGSFYGVMEMSGNLWERVVTIANPEGRAFDGSNGTGNISSLGFGGFSTWPGSGGVNNNNALGLMYRGGSSNFGSSEMQVSTRTPSNIITNPDNVRYIDQCGRGVRN